MLIRGIWGWGVEEELETWDKRTEAIIKIHALLVFEPNKSSSHNVIDTVCNVKRTIWSTTSPVVLCLHVTFSRIKNFIPLVVTHNILGEGGNQNERKHNKGYSRLPLNQISNWMNHPVTEVYNKELVVTEQIHFWSFLLPLGIVKVSERSSGFHTSVSQSFFKRPFSISKRTKESSPNFLVCFFFGCLVFLCYLTPLFCTFLT